MLLDYLIAYFVVTSDTIGQECPGLGVLPGFFAWANWLDLWGFSYDFLHDRTEIRFKLHLVLLERLEHLIEVLRREQLGDRALIQTSFWWSHFFYFFHDILFLFILAATFPLRFLALLSSGLCACLPKQHVLEKGWNFFVHWFTRHVHKIGLRQFLVGHGVRWITIIAIFFIDV